MGTKIQFRAFQIGTLTYCNEKLSIHCFFVNESDWDDESGVIIQDFLEKMHELGYVPFPDIFEDPAAEAIFSFVEKTEGVWVVSEALNHGKFDDHVQLQYIKVDVPNGSCVTRESNLMPVSSPIIFGRQEGLVLRGPKIESA